MAVCLLTKWLLVFNCSRWSRSELSRWRLSVDVFAVWSATASTVKHWRALYTVPRTHAAVGARGFSLNGPVTWILATCRMQSLSEWLDRRSWCAAHLRLFPTMRYKKATSSPSLTVFSAVFLRRCLKTELFIRSYDLNYWWPSVTCLLYVLFNMLLLFIDLLISDNNYYFVYCAASLKYF